MHIAKYCASCGALRADGAKFCKECGKPLPTVNAAVPEDTENGEASPVVADSPKTERLPINREHTGNPESSSEVLVMQKNNPEPEDITVIEDYRPQGSLKNTMGTFVNRVIRKPLLYGGVLIGLLLVAVIGWRIIAASSLGASAPLIYIKDYEMLLKMSKQDNPGTVTRNWLDVEDEGDSGEKIDFSAYSEGTSMQDTGFFQFGESVQQWVKLNAQKDRMFYLSGISDDGTANLYYSEPGAIVKAGEEGAEKATRIASNLSVDQGEAFKLSESGNYVLYLKNYEYDSGGSLYLYDMKNELLIDKDVDSFYVLSEDESAILYKKFTDNGTYDLYLKPVSSKGDKVKIDSDISSIVNYSADLKTVYYTKTFDDEMDNPNPYTLYVKQEGKDKQKLIADYAGLESSTADGQFFFTRTTEENTPLINFVNDNMATEDLQIKEPQYSDFEYQETYTDYWGDTYVTTEVDYDKYYDASNLYTAKLERDSLRSDLQNEELKTTSRQLYLYSDNAEKEIADPLQYVIYADAASKSVIFKKVVEGQIDKINLSELNGTSDVRSLYENSIGEDADSYMMLNGLPEQVMPEEAMKTNEFTFSEGGKKLYYLEVNDSEGGEYTSGALVVWDVIDGKLSNRTLVDDNVDHYMITGDKVWYYKDVKDDQGELITYSGGQKTKIAYDVQMGNVTLYPEDGITLYMTDYNEKRLAGSLYMRRGEETVKISDDVNFYNYNKGNSLFYVSDYRSTKGEGDLWEYRGKDKKSLVDSGVQSMLPLNPGLSF